MPKLKKGETWREGMNWLTLPRPLSFNHVSPWSTSLWKPRNIITNLVDNSFVCTLNMLEVKLFPTKCGKTYSYLYIIYCLFIKSSQICRYSQHNFYQHLHIYPSNGRPFLLYMSNSMWLCVAQSFTHACIFQMCPEDKMEACTHGMSCCFPWISNECEALKEFLLGLSTFLTLEELHFH